MSPDNLRIRYAIASDQFTREIERTFALAHRDPMYKPLVPTPRMLFWDDFMRQFLAEGWKARR